MSAPYAKVIVNPMAGGGSVRGQWPRIRRQLHDIGLSFDHEFTSGPGHALEIARRAIDSGHRYLIAVGGDGTVNEVANGILSSTHSRSIILGIVGCGTASSFARSMGISKDYASACSRLTGQGKALVDVGVVQCWSQGRSRERFFINVADAGFGAEVVDAWKHLPNRSSRRVNYALRTVAGLTCVLTHRNKLIKIHAGNMAEAICGCAVIVANGRYFAENMLIAPHARVDDGLLDIVVVGDVSKSELLKIWPTLYDGSHVRHLKIRETKATALTIESDEPLLIEADGDIIGETPASFRVIPSVLAVVV